MRQKVCPCPLSSFSCRFRFVFVFVLVFSFLFWFCALGGGGGRSFSEDARAYQEPIQEPNPTTLSSIPSSFSSRGLFHNVNTLSFSFQNSSKKTAVHASVQANTYAIYGTGQVKELTELVPGILNQLGPDSLASLRKLAESYQAVQQSQGGVGVGGRPGGVGVPVPGGGAEDDDDDDDVPDLVESFDVDEVTAAAAKANLEDVN